VQIALKAKLSRGELTPTGLDILAGVLDVDEFVSSAKSPTKITISANLMYMVPQNIQTSSPIKLFARVHVTLHAFIYISLADKKLYFVFKY
jgi:hypothetical protein